MNTAEATTYAASNIPIRNVWYLLLYAWDLAAWRGRWAAETEQSPSLLGLLARVLATGTRDLLRNQLGREFAARRDSIRSVRGRVDFARSLKRLDFEAGRAHCAFSELGVDTPRNRILRATLHRLATDARVDHAEPKKAEALRHELRTLVRDMEGIALTLISSADFGKLQLGRNDQRYSVLLAVCALVHRLELPTECAGDFALAALLRDAIVFHKLFERFVRNFYRHHLLGHEVGGETLQWPDELGCPFVPAMVTDTTLVERRPPHRRLVIDTKFHETTLSRGPYGAPKFKSENLYQLYAYLRTQERRSAAHRDAEGMLLYPNTGSELTDAMQVQGHRIRIATVDLAQPWSAIEARLLQLAIHQVDGHA